MDDLISRQAAIDAIDETDWYHQNRNGEMVHGANSDEHQAWYKADDIYKALEAVPPVDVVEVVRCADCKHSYETFAGWVCSHGVCIDCVVPYDFYCRYGERK